MLLMAPIALLTSEITALIGPLTMPTSPEKALAIISAKPEISVVMPLMIGLSA